VPELSAAEPAASSLPPSRREAEASPRSPLLASIVVGLSEGAAAYLVVQSLALWIKGHTEHVETALYIAAFGGILPGSILSSLRWGRRLAAEQLATVASLDVLGLMVFLAAARLGGGVVPVLFCGGAAVLAGNRLVAGRTGRLSLRPTRPVPLQLALVSLLFVTLALFLPSNAYTVRRFVLSLAACGVLLALYALVRTPRARIPRALDIAAILLIGSLAFDVFFWAGWLVDPQNSHVGPVNELLHGRTMLVDDFSQYGVGDMYFVAAFFTLVPIGYGTFSLLVSALAALQLAVLYVIVRVAGRSFLLAVLASAVAIVFVIFGQLESFVVYPMTGALRFGPPYVVILLEVLAPGRPARSRALRSASILVVALASLWSLETFVYTAGTYLAIAGVEAAVAPSPWREALRRRLLPVAGWVLAFQFVFTFATKGASGSWPDWAGYVDYVRLFSTGRFGTLPVNSWSPGFLLAALCLASAVLLSALVIRRQPIVRSRPELFVALAGSTAFAILAFTYFLGRSHPNNLHHVAPPAIVLCALWLSVLAEPGFRELPVLRVGFAAVALWSALLLIAGSWKEVQAKWTHSALGTFVGVSPSALVNRVNALASNPAIDPRAQEGANLLAGFDPASSRSLVLLEPNLTTEVLVRAERGNALPIPTLAQEELLPRLVRRVVGAVPGLPPGTIMLTQTGYLGEQPSPGVVPVLTEQAVWQVRARFVLRTLKTVDGLAVVRLVRTRAQP
jgi:hypothetical protein